VTCLVDEANDGLDDEVARLMNLELRETIEEA
jgi:hypothetical protein